MTRRHDDERGDVVDLDERRASLIVDDNEPPPPSDDDIPPEQAKKSDERKSQATVMVELALRDATVWTGDDDEQYITIDVDGHAEHHRIRSRRVREWLADSYYAEAGGTPGGQSRSDALEVLCGAARRGERYPVFTRIAEHDGRIYLDLTDSSWRAVEIDAEGWRVMDAPPVRFRRGRGMRPLPEPEAGRLDELREHIRVTDDSWPLVAGFLVGAMAPRGPYPVLVLRGPHGAGKSVTARALRELVDPSMAPIRSEPREPRDLIVAGQAAWVVAIDNISSIPGWLSDGLCRIATGGGYSARQLYTDGEEYLVDIQRPTILTGITDVVTAPDLLDRSLLVELQPLPEGDRRTERELRAAWIDARPRILGGLLDAVACALRRRSEVRLESRPRMADWATWATAAEPAMGLDGGAVVAAHAATRTDAAEIALEASPIAGPIRDLAAEHTVWTGTAAEMLAELTERAGDAAKRRTWPRTPRGLAGMLARIAPPLREAGIVVERLPREHGGRRPWRIEGVANPPSPPSPRDNVAESREKSGDGHGDGRSGTDTSSPQPSPEKFNDSGAGDDGDDGDDPSHTPSTETAHEEHRRRWEVYYRHLTWPQFCESVLGEGGPA